MTTTDRHGRECHGTADAAALDDHCDEECRETLAAEIRAAMSPDRGASSALARKCGVTPACIGDILHANKGVSPELLVRIGLALRVDLATRDRWHALARHVAPDLVAALLDAPERWGEVRALLAGGAR